MAHILIIEDDRDINDILYDLLCKAGHDVARAYNGKEAGPLIDKSPDLILMDLMLPDTTGEKLLEKVADGTPVIAVSARSQTVDKVDLLNRGCVDYVTKPFEEEELLARIRLVLRRRSYHAPENANAPEEPDDLLRCGELTLSESHHEVKYAGSSLSISIFCRVRGCLKPMCPAWRHWPSRDVMTFFGP